eukprot:jgi/Astpho2/9175/fgenesh1_pm.00137_%23_2_t
MRRKQEGMMEKVHKYRGVLTLVTIPVLLVALIFFVMPRSSPDSYTSTADTSELVARAQENNPVPDGEGSEKYAVVMDAGSTGSRVHVYKFLENDGVLELQSDTFEQLKPGLSSYPDDPQKAAESLQPLLDKALATVPASLQATTPIMLGATAGLRLLPEGKADKILDAVRKWLGQFAFNLDKKSGVTILDGSAEGAFAWLTLNYLLGHLGKPESQTMAAIDLGGGSVQEAFALSDAQAKAAPDPLYVTSLSGGGRSYHVYVHSYLGYGLMAGRAATSCSFAGAWGGGQLPKAFYVSSYFWDRALEAEIITDDNAVSWKLTADDLKEAADKACKASLKELKALFPDASDEQAPFMCLDLSFCHTLLTQGFKVASDTDVTLVKRIKYKEQEVEAAWPLGAAIDLLNS